MNPIEPAPTSITEINDKNPVIVNVPNNEVPKVPETPESPESPKLISETDSTLAQDIAAAQAETAQEHLDRANVINQPIDKVVDNSASVAEDKLLNEISAK